ncbi:hypothetical protein GCK72_021600 [Caenorhabditis remanei]|uniref:Uncharacterized protein n=1 Tax=Caenorhabditis remanei TaxID=31234 RepID=A0A6A5GK41_CAERE|nr:hypothetical protein GCK72_021600 [Caenorhabditis remanei]KAF1755033.1 hypothetical protein GCK72_021600 [Caenorhabditis remanei]
MLSGAKLPRDILFGFPLLILWNSLLGVVPTSSFPNPSGTEFDCSPVPQEGSVVAVAQESWGGRGSGLCDAKRIIATNDTTLRCDICSDAYATIPRFFTAEYCLGSSPGLIASFRSRLILIGRFCHCCPVLRFD